MRWPVGLSLLGTRPEKGGDQAVEPTLQGHGKRRREVRGHGKP